MAGRAHHGAAPPTYRRAGRRRLYPRSNFLLLRRADAGVPERAAGAATVKGEVFRLHAGGYGEDHLYNAGRRERRSRPLRLAGGHPSSSQFKLVGGRYGGRNAIRCSAMGYVAAGAQRFPTGPGSTCAHGVEPQGPRQDSDGGAVDIRPPNRFVFFNGGGGRSVSVMSVILGALVGAGGGGEEGGEGVGVAGWW